MNLENREQVDEMQRRLLFELASVTAALSDKMLGSIAEVVATELEFRMAKGQVKG